MPWFILFLDFNSKWTYIPKFNFISYYKFKFSGTYLAYIIRILGRYFKFLSGTSSGYKFFLNLILSENIYFYYYYYLLCLSKFRLFFGKSYPNTFFLLLYILNTVSLGLCKSANVTRIRVLSSDGCTPTLKRVGQTPYWKYGSPQSFAFWSNIINNYYIT